MMNNTDRRRRVKVGVQDPNPKVKEKAVCFYRYVMAKAFFFSHLLRLSQTRLEKDCHVETKTLHVYLLIDLYICSCMETKDIKSSMNAILG